MSDADRVWDADDRLRPRRANRGALLPALLETGLDSEEEHLLRDLSEATTDSAFCASSDEETVDDVDSDFSAPEEDGCLADAAPETDGPEDAETREARRRTRQRMAQRANGDRAVAPLRLRPPPTIPPHVRLAAAQQRAREGRVWANAAVEENASPQRPRSRRRRVEAATQRVRFTSSRAVWEQYGVPVIVSFSDNLPPILQQAKQHQRR